MILMLLIYYIFFKPTVEKKAISKTKITLDLNQIKTAPPPREPENIKKIISPQNPPPKPIQKQKTPQKEENQKPTPKPPPPKKVEKKETQAKGLIEKRFSKKEDNTTKKIKITTKPKPKPPKKVAKKRPKKHKPKKVTKHHKKHHKKPTQRVVKRRHRPRGPSAPLINALYGSSYSRMSSAQRKFIDNNLRRILLISQRTLNYLGYPREAMVMGQSGTNIVEFWLYPNGDIKGLRLKRRIGATALDHQTIEVIKTAYMNYPRPPVKTKIIIYVSYQLY
jgi:TonB family protein